MAYIPLIFVFVSYTTEFFFSLCVHVALNSQIRRDYYRGSQESVAETRRTSTSSLYSGGCFIC